MLDMANKIKGFQRRATQKVMQQMGLADKTQDDSNDHTYQNFHALGSFTSQLKATIQATDTNFEKLCTAQSHLAGQVQSYLHSELSGDADLPPGELYEFFNNSTIPDAHMHAVILQEVSEKFYGACSEIGNNLLRSLVGKLDDAVVKPIMKDEEYNVLTKELIEEKKRATLDYDSYRRMANNTNSPNEQEKYEVKVRNYKERLDIATRRVAEHIEQRNRIRCKVLIHGILTAIQQYSIFYAAAGDILKETASAIKPLVDVYQLSESQLLDTVNLEAPTAAPQKQGPRNPQRITNADSLFEEHAQNNGAPPRPAKNPTAKSAAAPAPTRNASPQPPRDSQLDDLLQQNITGMKKPATTPNVPNKNTPMNQQVPPTKTPPPTQSPPPPQNQNQSPPNPVPPQNQNQTPSPPPKPAPSLVDDPFGDTWASTAQPTAAPVPSTTTPQTADFLNLGDLHSSGPSVTSPPPQPAKNTLYDDLLGFSAPLQPSSTPLQPNLTPLQPSFTPLQPQRSTNSPTPAKAAPQNPTPQQPRAGGNYGATGGFPAGYGAPPMQPQPAAAKPQAQAPGFGGGFDHFDSMFGPTPTPAAQPTPTPTPTPASNSGAGAFYSQPTPAAAQSYVPQHQVQEQEERHELNPAVTDKINNWAQRGGRQNNLRSLLSTLHEVIWVDSGWDALSLAELVTPVQVKKAYLRANKIVHPDKIQQGTVEQKLIAQRLFEALRVSYEAFDRDELSK